MSASLQTLITSSAPEPEVCPYIHESFRPGRKIGSPGVGYREIKSFSSPGFARSMDYQQKNKLILPRLPKENSQAQRKNKNCSFINNHKNYLKLKGIDINDIYSLRRNRTRRESIDNGPKNAVDLNSKLANLSKSDLVLPLLFVDEFATPRRGSTQKDSESVWRPGDSLKPHDIDLTFGSLNQRCDKVAKVPSHVRLGYLTSNRLGKVMTKTHLRSLLAQEQPVKNTNFYTKSTDRI